MAKRVPKYARVAAAVQGLIADGTLRPGQPAPSGAALSRVTGYSTLTCRRALRVLVADGVLTPGPSRNARPRVAGPPQRQAARDLAAASRALSAGLATRRRSFALTQPELAGLIGVSVTTIGHAETGRLWQSRDFWVHADAVLGAGGALLGLHDAFGEASAVSAASAANDLAAADAGSTDAAGSSDAAGSAAADSGGAGSAGAPAHPEGAGTAASGGAPTAAPDAAPAPAGGAHAAGPGGALLPRGQGTEQAAGLAGVRSAVRGHGAPACVMIMWGDGTVTTVHPPEAPAPEAGLAGPPAPDEPPPS